VPATARDVAAAASGLPVALGAVAFVRWCACAVVRAYRGACASAPDVSTRRAPGLWTGL